MAMKPDPDIIIARQVAAACSRGGTDYRRYMIDGHYDQEEAVQTALIAIKVGRGLNPLTDPEA